MKRSPSIIRLIQLIGLCFIGTSIHAQQYKSEFGFKLENDFFISKDLDRYYTHGTFLHYNTALKVDTNITYFNKKLLAVEIGQKIYNPFWSNAPDVSTHDRPFSGYSYGSVGMRWFKSDEKMIFSKLELGIIGPSSMAEKVQTSFHKFLKTYYPVTGWEYQIKDEFVLNFNLKYLKKIKHAKNNVFDLHYFGNAHLGNFNTNVAMGGLLRFGKFNSINQSSMFNARINHTKSSNKQKAELFLFYQPQLNFVIYDASIQGGLFNADKGPVTYKLEPFVFKQTVGVNVAYSRLSLKYFVTFNTKEVKSDAKSYYFGGVGLNYLLHKNN